MLDSLKEKLEDSGQHEQRANAAVPTSTEVDAPMNVLPASHDTTPGISSARGIVVHGRRYLTIGETSAMMRVSRRTIYNWIALGSIRSVLGPGATRYVEYDSIEMVAQSPDSIKLGYSKTEAR